jgi:hypothetical protein
MTPAEIARVFEGRVGTAVRIVTTQGETALLNVLWVDGEGVSCNVADHPDYDPGKTHWWSFDEIAEAAAADEERPP